MHISVAPAEAGAATGFAGTSRQEPMAAPASAGATLQ